MGKRLMDFPVKRIRFHFPRNIETIRRLDRIDFSTERKVNLKSGLCLIYALLEWWGTDRKGKDITYQRKRQHGVLYFLLRNGDFLFTEEVSLV